MINKTVSANNKNLITMKHPKLTSFRRQLGVFALCLLAASAAEAALVKKMDLSEVCSHSGSIFRGIILSAESGEVTAGGAVLPTVTYRV